ncbi:FecR domain-containing protein [Mucilaginibacter daejeonensis]|uniref:FecR family protein n=1 Tax=Mucilaginibacter daejeonensis TaxID=398049 RepID=UPI001D16FC38|nr:FecR family protein [Mucilaginibacter daejeonensis]UEG51913.1 FecR domain-containing protein [Mucilaginibacter daejeonensis]
MTSEQLAELMERYQKGTCTPEEAAILEQWYSSYDTKANILDSLPAADRDRLQQRMYDRISDKTGIEQEKRSNAKIISLWAKIAVAAVLTSMVIFFAWNKRSLESKPAVTDSWANVINSGAGIVKHNLPDGSTVWLKPGSSLKYVKTFNAISRDVAMNGECFFEVIKDPQRPFVIVSKHIVTKVWGTSFRVKDANDATKATVTVMTGKVSVSKTGSEAHQAGARLLKNEVMLLPDQQATYSTTQNQLTANRHADMSDMALWKHTDLSFNDQSVAQIASVLSKRFDVDITIEGEHLKKASMTADLNGLNLPEVLDVLKTSMKIDYAVITNDRIILRRTNL